MYRTDFWTLWAKARVGCFKRTASKLVYFLGWNRSPAQVGCMRQVLGAGALARSRGMGWGGRLEEGSGWGTHVNPWLIHVNVRQNPLQYCKVISLQLIKINGKKKSQASLQQYVNHELPDVQAGFRKGRRTRYQIVNIFWIIKKQGSSRNTSTSALLTMPKALTVCITINHGKLFEMGIPDHLTGLLKNLISEIWCRSRSNS